MHIYNYCFNTFILYYYVCIGTYSLFILQCSASSVGPKFRGKIKMQKASDAKKSTSSWDIKIAPKTELNDNII